MRKSILTHLALALLISGLLAVVFSRLEPKVNTQTIGRIETTLVALFAKAAPYMPSSSHPASLLFHGFIFALAFVLLVAICLDWKRARDRRKRHDDKNL